MYACTYICTCTYIVPTKQTRQQKRPTQGEYIHVLGTKYLVDEDGVFVVGEQARVEVLLPHSYRLFIGEPLHKSAIRTQYTLRVNNTDDSYNHTQWPAPSAVKN